MLIIISTPPSHSPTVPELNPDDAVLLIGNGLYWTTFPLPWNAPIYAIEQHRLTRGLAAIDRIRYIAEDNMVALTIDHCPVVTL